MKANLLKSVFVIAIAMIAGVNVYNAQEAEPMSDVAMANVEALASDESGTGRCSKAIAWANCYNNSNGMWNCMIVKAVEKYDVEEGSIIVCRHDKVTKCPDGTYESL